MMTDLILTRIHSSRSNMSLKEDDSNNSISWSHADLTTLSTADATTELTQLENAYVSIIGVIPQYFRPPYISYNTAVLSLLQSLGYHVITDDIDTLDWEGDYTAAYNNYVAGINSGGRLSLAHDVDAGTVQTLAQEMINTLKAAGLTPVTVGTCLGDPPANWYRGPRSGTSTATSTGPSSTPVSGGKPSPDGTCGGSNAYTCPSGQCCSQYGVGLAILCLVFANSR
jgi:hypothetical protein